MDKEIKYAKVMVGDKILSQVLNSCVQGRPTEYSTPYHEIIKKIRWETSEDGNHTDLVIETEHSIISYNERYVVCWGVL